MENATVRRARWILLPGAIAVTSRVYSLVLLWALGAGGTRRDMPLWAIWDGGWYASIAQFGYHGGTVRGGYDFAFFPAWPVVLKAAGTLGIPYGVTAVLGASLLFVAAAVLVWRAVDQRLGAATATSSVALLGFAPPAFVFSIAYAESLFVFAVALYFATAATSRWRLVSAALAVFTRTAGLAVVAVAAVDAIRSRGPARRTAIATVLAGLLAFLVWWLFVAFLTGELAGYLRGTSAWFHGSPLRNIVATARAHPWWVFGWAAFVAVISAGAALVARRHPDWATLCIVVVGSAMLPVVGGGILHSVPRYVLVAFPAYAGLADRLGRRGTIVLVVVFAIAQALFARMVVGPRGTVAP